jgi:hypothetical protein
VAGASVRNVRVERFRPKVSWMYAVADAGVFLKPPAARMSSPSIVP